MNRQLLTIGEWNTKAKAGEDLSEAVVRKQYVAHLKAVDGEERTFECTISTATPDRDKDVVVQAGIDVTSYLENPVVLFGHKYDLPPVAKSIKLWIEGGAWKSLMQFVPQGVYAFADTIEALYRLGFMRAVSVGFIPKKYAFDEERRGYDILECELLEYSCVPVPANPQALAMAKSTGVDLSPLKAMLEDSLAQLEGPGLWVPKHVAIEAMKLATGTPKLSPPPTPAPEAEPTPVPSKGFKPSEKHLQAAMTAAIETAVRDRVNHALGRVGD